MVVWGYETFWIRSRMKDSEEQWTSWRYRRRLSYGMSMSRGKMRVVWHEVWWKWKERERKRKAKNRDGWITSRKISRRKRLKATSGGDWLETHIAMERTRGKKKRKLKHKSQGNWCSLLRALEKNLLQNRVRLRAKRSANLGHITILPTPWRLFQSFFDVLVKVRGLRWW